MKSVKPGKNTSKAEILNISKFGIWILVHKLEYFLPFKAFPWFSKARVSEIYKVQLLHGSHLYWPDLDIDLALDSLGNLEKYPLVFK